VRFFGEMYGFGGKELRQRVDEVLDYVAMRERADDRVDTYSGGMKRRINLAVALVSRPRVLFLDEPTVGVDPQSRNHIFESVERLNREQGMTILYTTHYMEEAERLCQRVGIIDHGKIIALDTPANLIAMLGGGIIEIGLEQANEDLRSAGGCAANRTVCHIFRNQRRRGRDRRTGGAQGGDQAPGSRADRDHQSLRSARCCDALDEDTRAES
jgi:ABC-2 type transport system ATP-binding protein